MIDDDVPSRVRNSGLPGHYAVETDGDKKYMTWLMASDIDERQVLQCVDVAYQICQNMLLTVGILDRVMHSPCSWLPSFVQRDAHTKERTMLNLPSAPGQSSKYWLWHKANQIRQQKHQRTNGPL